MGAMWKDEGGGQTATSERRGANLRHWELSGDPGPDLKSEGQFLAFGRQKSVIGDKNARQWERKALSVST